MCLPKSVGATKFIYMRMPRFRKMFPTNGANYWGLSVMLAYLGAGWCPSNPGLTVAQASAIDTKIDDGFPISGNVFAAYLNNDNVNGYGTDLSQPVYVNPGGSATSPGTTAIQGTSATCYDNGNGSGPQQYSLAQNNGAGINCALSFRFQ